MLITTYVAVFVAELAGDKLLYTTGILASRFPTVSILLGLAIAFAAKMGIAVGAGTLISAVPPSIVAAITVINFAAIALVLWRRGDGTASNDRSTSRGVTVSFAAVFLSEWGDLGQITAATMAARYALLLPVWVGAVAAMMTKGILAASIGSGCRRWLLDRFSPRMIRCTAVCLVLILGTLSALETMNGGRPLNR